MEMTSQDNQESPLSLDFLPENSSVFSNLKSSQLHCFKLSTVLFFITAYFYVLAFFDGQTVYFFPIALSLLALPEFLAQKLQSPFKELEKTGGNRLESRIFLGLTLSQSLALSIWGFHLQLEFFQFLVLHLSFGFYILSRTGWLSQGRLGILIWFDGISAFFILPFRHFLSGLQVLFQKDSSKNQEKQNLTNSRKTKHLLFISISLAAAGLLVLFVWSQLSQVSEKFASLTSSFGVFLQNLSTYFYSTINLEQIYIYSILAIPISLYLYGLVIGSLLAKKSHSFTYQLFQKKIQPFRVFPSYTVYIIIGSLCIIYTLFFLTGLSELNTLVSSGTAVSRISAQDASNVAVSGFWQLVQVSLLNFAVLGAFYLLSKEAPWNQKGTRLATTLLFIFASLLALLAAWKLFGIYIFLYGPTPLRLLSAWFILVLLVWCLLTLIRLYKPIQAIRIGVFYALISFTILSYLYPLLISK